MFGSAANSSQDTSSISQLSLNIISPLQDQLVSGIPDENDNFEQREYTGALIDTIILLLILLSDVQCSMERIRN